MVIENGDRVRLEYVGRLADGTVFDTSRESVAEETGMAEEMPEREYEPLTVEIGEGRIIDGLEQALIGLEAGATETITVEPEDAYGEPSDEHVQEYDAGEFGRMLQGEEPEKGMRIQTQQGGIGEIVHADAETVRVDFNHELAGETLEFEVEIIDVE